MLPDTSKCSKTVVLCDVDGDPRWDQAMLLTGASIRKVKGDRETLMQAVQSADIACIAWSDGYNEASIPISELVEIGHAAGVKVVVDGASRLPPVSNLWDFTGVGADVAIFSCGKAMRGPQTGGIMIGTNELIKGARANGSPNEAAVCRAMKSSKETIVGVVTAVEDFVAEQLSMEVRLAQEVFLFVRLLERS